MLRSLLFAPGDNQEIAEKASESKADGVILDLEDAVAPAKKKRARQLVAEFLDGHEEAATTICVRINSWNHAEQITDIELVAHDAVDVVVVPMVETEREAWHTAEMVERFETCKDATSASLFLILETAKGLANANEIASAHEKIEMISFGLADYTADANIRSTENRAEVLTQRALLSNAAAAANVQAFDFATLETENLDRVRADAVAARQMGYTGKAAIHPTQLEPIHEVFTPDREEIERARKIVEAYEEAGEPGVLTVDGEMVDKPVIESARDTLALVDEYTSSVKSE
ncbi:HpcH/HpaI aldolase/citrate lyase family protein [Halorarum salinum]|uniref:CoA ester lyase n=1 Tax=Halorarum salinum TaxID=2743089 RepID=A0A7D5QDX4_9EURY|nr:CoA ester lyase [Halobaculum salinum]QLG60283.1 CoA ester lyase [Halobaculum salinum]